MTGGKAAIMVVRVSWVYQENQMTRLSSLKKVKKRTVSLCFLLRQLLNGSEEL